MGDKLYRIRYTPLAYEDLDAIDDYISTKLQNPKAAIKLMSEIENSISHLKKHPFIGTAVGDVFLSEKGYRKLVVGNYLIFHLVNQEQREVIIMRVIHGARKYRNLL